jgi:hypothetical protein
MIARVKEYFQGCRRRYGMLQEARAILKALDLPSAAAPDPEVLSIVMNIGLGHLRAAKRSHDITAAAREMELRIQQGPRPSHYEASQN